MAAASALVLFALLWLARDLIAEATTGDILLFGGIALSIAVIITGVAIANVLLPSLSDRAAGSAELLHAIAHGDLTRAPDVSGDNAREDQVAAATHSLVVALRSSIGEVRAAAREVTSRAQDLGLEHSAAVSASQRMTEGSASTAQQGVALLELMRGARTEANQFIAGAAHIVEAARAQRAREQRLRDQTRQSLDHLERGAASLADLTTGVSASAEQLDLLAGASEEIRSFVTLVRKMARQSKLLALNAAMEAARAGEHGSGFAVVAGEVRRLAKSSNEAADRTDQLVSSVLERLESVRGASARAVDALRVVSESTTGGIASLRQLESETASAVTGAAHEDDASGRVTAAGDTLVLRLDQLAREADLLSRALLDSSSLASAQQTRLQEMAAAVSGLGRAASRAQTAATAFRTEQPAGGAPSPAGVTAPDLVLTDALRGATT